MGRDRQGWPSSRAAVAGGGQLPIQNFYRVCARKKQQKDKGGEATCELGPWARPPQMEPKLASTFAASSRSPQASQASRASRASRAAVISRRRSRGGGASRSSRLGAFRAGKLTGTVATAPPGPVTLSTTVTVPTRQHEIRTTYSPPRFASARVACARVPRTTHRRRPPRTSWGGPGPPWPATSGSRTVQRGCARSGAWRCPRRPRSSSESSSRSGKPACARGTGMGGGAHLAPGAFVGDRGDLDPHHPRPGRKLDDGGIGAANGGEGPPSTAQGELVAQGRLVGDLDRRPLASELPFAVGRSALDPRALGSRLAFAVVRRVRALHLRGLGGLARDSQAAAARCGERNARSGRVAD